MATRAASEGARVGVRARRTGGLPHRCDSSAPAHEAVADGARPCKRRGRRVHGWRRSGAGMGARLRGAEQSRVAVPGVRRVLHDV